MNDTLSAALAYCKAGLSVITIKADGSKAPEFSWKQYQEKAASEQELRHRFGDGKPHGIAIVWGAISGHGEALDFDEPGLYELFAARSAELGFGGLIESMPLVETPSGGRHLYYRCSGSVSGNQKLAERASGDGKIKTLIETRGEGGYTLAPGSPPECHPAGKPYRFLRGRPASIPTITMEELETLHAIASTFDENAKQPVVNDVPRVRKDAIDLSPGDDYNQRGNDTEALLEREGWRCMRRHGDKTCWQRPGKDGDGLSATLNYKGSGLFHCFSSNAAPFEPGQSYSPFAVFAFLRHGGDYSAAAKALAAEGYGTQIFKSAASAGTQQPAAALRRKPFVDRIIDLADVPAPPLELPCLFGHYFMRGAIHWMTGGTGLGKSTFGYNVASALAVGRETWDIPCAPCRVLYIDLESGDLGRSLKVQRLYRDKERPRERLFFLCESVSIFDDFDDLLAYVRSNQIDLVIFDTARRCFRVKDENDNAEVYAKVFPLLDALKASGVASLTFGHPAKNDNSRARGAGAQEDAGDVNLSLTVHSGEANSDSAIIAVKVTKHRLLGLSIPPLYLRRNGNDEFERVYVEPGVQAENIDIKQSAVAKCGIDILGYLNTLPTRHARHGEIQDSMLAKGHSQATINRSLKQALTDNWVRKSCDGYLAVDPFDDDDDKP